MILKYIIEGCKFFIIQSILEIVCIVVLMYMGFSYSGMVVGGEYFYEVLISVLGYHGLFKLMIYGIPYLFLFVIINFILKNDSQKIFVLINTILSFLLPTIILFIRNLTLSEMKSVFISTIFSSLLIIIFIKFKSTALHVYNE